MKTGDQLTNFRHYDIIREQVGEIPTGSLIHFFSRKKWHSYELLWYILSITGKADVTVTTFGLSEEAIRALYKARDYGYIDSLRIIINSVSRKYKKKLLYYLNNLNCDIFLENVHLKLFLIRNEKYNIVVNQSANFSKNPTIEAGIIANDINTYDYYRDQVEKIINTSKLWTLQK